MILRFATSMMETSFPGGQRHVPDALAHAEHPSGTVRINTDSTGLENIGGVKVKLTGVLCP
jgi:hypothetical protein